MTTPETPESEDANMNKCPMCGHVSEDGANFCSRCGTRLGVPIDTPGDNTGVIPTITEPTVAEETLPMWIFQPASCRTSPIFLLRTPC